MANEREEGLATAEVGSQRDLLLSLAETLIPARRTGGRMPAASELAEFRDMSSEEAQLLYGPVLELLRTQSSAAASQHFASLDLQARESILRGLESDYPDVVRSAVTQTLLRYYGADAVVEALGLEARPPHPQGYALAETNWALLDPVREMDSIYKAAPRQGEES
jgi:hypothetical protein